VVSRTLALLAAVAGAAALAASAAQADTGGFTHLTQIGRVRSPERAFLLDLPPGTSVAHRQVQVRENGRRIDGFSFAPIQAVDGRFGVILLIDASDSMRGSPSKAALAAARAFVRRAGPSEQIGVVAFNRKTSVLATPADGAGALRAALSRPLRLGYGTHIYDAVGTALEQLRGTDVSSGSVVLLSDGADTGSRLDEARAAERARAEHVRVFTVGLHSASFRASPLRKLALDTGGSYSEAVSAGDLASIYESLGRQLSSEYVIRYRSRTAPGTHVSVSVRVADVGTVSAEYVTARPAPIAPFSRSLFERFWSSPASMVLIALLAASLAALGALLLLRVPKGTLLKRISEFVSVVMPEDERAHRAALTTKVFAGAEESLAKTQWWARFQEELEIARISIPAVHILFGAAFATLLAAIVLYLISPIFIVFALGVPFIVRELVQRKLKGVRGDFAEQLPDNLQVLASALRAGHSFVGALAVVAADAPEPAQREFQRVVADDQLGVPIEDSLREVARRMESSELEQVGLLAELQRESGGNMAEVLETVVETIRERFDLRRLVKTLTAQGRMARWILTLLPVFLAVAISLLNPAYMRPLFATTPGQVLVALATVMVVTGSLVIKRIVNIKV
jgi:tight adherence protein B